jgi:hypothetical protein
MLALPPNRLQDFSNSPATGREGLKLVLIPKSEGRAPAAEAGAASAAKSASRSAAAAAGGATGGRSRLSQAGPSMAPAAFEVEENEEGQELERTQEIELPQASAHKAAAPLSASRRRSHSRTPGTKIVIIERGTGGRGTPTSAARAAAGASTAKQQAQVGTSPVCNPVGLPSCLLSGKLSHSLHSHPS